jgi:hypothetical protein
VRRDEDIQCTWLLAHSKLDRCLFIQRLLKKTTRVIAISNLHKCDVCSVLGSVLSSVFVNQPGLLVLSTHHPGSAWLCNSLEPSEAVPESECSVKLFPVADTCRKTLLEQEGTLPFPLEVSYLTQHRLYFLNFLKSKDPKEKHGLNKYCV